MAKESYQDLVFQLGDLARERLVSRPNAPRSMDRVLKAEEALVLRQQELQELEASMNAEDEAWNQFLADLENERAEKMVLVKRWGKAVEGILGRVKDLRKQIAAKKADLKYGQQSLKMAEKKHADYEMTANDPQKVELSRQNLKKLRLGHMRQARNIEELEYQFNQAFEVGGGQPGGPGEVAQSGRLAGRSSTAWTCSPNTGPG